MDSGGTRIFPEQNNYFNSAVLRKCALVKMLMYCEEVHLKKSPDCEILKDCTLDLISIFFRFSKPDVKFPTQIFISIKLFYHYAKDLVFSSFRN